ncbi:hypothetical protein DICVIV_07823 [Dictyocaulus viviparus]|uniref:Flavin-containing monooxygenase n=1 Tax=Dictyocaulus viviparus TaxID=29172 RepID=A0A0D8XNA2_DICVI|nr:hypothetical protein DICVIV_07823 [Dictyocaulus viviparus]
MQILFKDPKFAWRLFKGANVPYVYRLVGPNKWDGAEEAIRFVPNRVKIPLKARNCRMRSHKRRGTLVRRVFPLYKYEVDGGMVYYLLCKWFGSDLLWDVYIHIVIFCSRGNVFRLFSFMLLWFDLQYDMTTIL